MKESRKAHGKNRLIPWRAAIVSAAALFLLAALAGYGLLFRYGGVALFCPIRRLTGLSCPGCGLTHALGALVSGHPLTALSYNALLPLYAVWGIWTYLSVTLPYMRGGSLRPDAAPLWLHVTTLAAALVYAILRNLI